MMNRQWVPQSSTNGNGYIVYTGTWSPAAPAGPPAQTPDPGTNIWTVPPIAAGSISNTWVNATDPTQPLPNPFPVPTGYYQAAGWNPPQNTWLPLTDQPGSPGGWSPPGSGPVQQSYFDPTVAAGSYPVLRCDSDPSVGSDPQASTRGLVYTNPATANGPWASTNYLANWNAITDGDDSGYAAAPQSFAQIKDGLSNTILFAEGYAWCQGMGRVAMLAWLTSSKNYIPTGGATPLNNNSGGVHNFGLTSALSGANFISLDGGATQVPYQTMPNGTPNPTATVNFMFQIRPLNYPPATCPAGKECCNGLTAQTGHSSMNVALADGSVRSVTKTITPATWYAAMLPDDGTTLGSDW